MAIMRFVYCTICLIRTNIASRVQSVLLIRIMIDINNQTRLDRERERDKNIENIFTRIAEHELCPSREA